ncbi:hypothetical protein F511_26284 [Dorcoceras hygrometricum]|uniref:Uncharacterized protein n=1 Tax=Dorcoceras hygrometricum TaxID=472368 RepID=A0A2Z7AFX4_9LAMI|nr:hypothetical protein F511_26284 [Dorcoceras hygrometricum]
MNRSEKEASTSQQVKALDATEDKPQKYAKQLSNDAMYLLVKKFEKFILPAVDSSDERESGSIGLLLLRRFVWILFLNVCLKLLPDVAFCALVFEQLLCCRGAGGGSASLWQAACCNYSSEDLRHGSVALHTLILLSSPVLLAMPVLLNCEYQDAMFKDERVVPVYLGGDRVTPVPQSPCWVC